MTEQTQPSPPPGTPTAPDVAPQEIALSPEAPAQSGSEASQPQPATSAPTEAAPKSAKKVPVPEDLALRVEAALMTTDRAISAAKLSEILGGVATKPIGEAIDELNKIYDKTGRSFRVEQLAGGYQIVTLPQYAQVLANLHKARQSNKLTAAAMETLAIIAYKQPILRAEIEAIRGVSSGETARSLMEKHLVKIVGRAEEIGRPMLYGTTKQFLEVFGLATLKDLPNAGELRPPKPRALIPAKDELGLDGVATSDITETNSQQSVTTDSVVKTMPIANASVKQDTAPAGQQDSVEENVTGERTEMPTDQATKEE